jgi:hypothetical protein
MVADQTAMGYPPSRKLMLDCQNYYVSWTGMPFQVDMQMGQNQSETIYYIGSVL